MRPSHGGKPENVGVSRRLSQCPLANHCPAGQMAASLAKIRPAFSPAARQEEVTAVMVAVDRWAIGREAAQSRIAARIAAASS